MLIYIIQIKYINFYIKWFYFALSVQMYMYRAGS